MGLEGHGLDIQSGAFGIEPRDPTGRHRRPRYGCHDGQRHGARLRVGRRGHLPPALGANRGPGCILAGLAVVADDPSFDIHDEDLSGTQSAALDGLHGGDGDGTALGGGGHQPGRGDAHGQRPEPIAVEHRTDTNAVTEAQRCRPIPGRQEAGRPSSQCVQLGHRIGAQPRGIWDGDQQGGIQAPAGSDQQLERLVEGEGVGGVLVEQRTESREPLTDPAAELGPPTAHLLAIAAHRVDLAVVGEHPEGLRQRPRGVGVGRVALVKDGVAERQVEQQVGVERAQLLPSDEPLVDHGPGRCRGHREVGQSGRAAGDLHPAPGEEQALLEVGAGGPGWRRHDGLDDGRQGAPRIAPERIGIDGHIAPRVHGQAFRVGGRHKRCACLLGRPSVAGQEHHEHTRIAGDARRDEPKERSLERQHDARAVTGRAIGRESTAMCQRAQARERERQDTLPCCPGRVRHEADATGVMFGSRVVQRVGGIERHSATSEGMATPRHPDPRTSLVSDGPAPYRPHSPSVSTAMVLTRLRMGYATSCARRVGRGDATTGAPYPTGVRPSRNPRRGRSPASVPTR